MPQAHPSPGGGHTANSPELPTFHPQPRRPLLVTPLLESAAPPPASPARKWIPLGAERQATQHQSADGSHGGRASREPYTQTPSPDREAISAFPAEHDDPWTESPGPNQAHRSVQNTPEPTQYCYYGQGPIGLGLPIQTPSPNLAGACGGNQPYGSLGIAPRFPWVPQSGGLMTVPPPLLSGSAAGPLSQQQASFNAPFPVSAEGIDAGLLTQSSKTSGQAQASGAVQHGHQMPGMQAANPQDAHHVPQAVFSQAFAGTPSVQGQSSGTLSAGLRPLAAGTSAGLMGWRMPGCPMPMEFSASRVAVPGFSNSSQQDAQGPLPLVPAHFGSTGPTGGAAASSAAAVTPASATGSRGARSSAPQPAGSIGLGAGPGTSTGSDGTAASKWQPDALPVGNVSNSAEAQELRGNVVQLSKTQQGSKQLQRLLQRGNSSGFVDIILGEVEQDIAGLMCDPYANYLCSAVFQACSSRQRLRMLHCLAPRVAAIACDKRGTHALQALIGLLTTSEEQEFLVRSLQNHVIDMCMDANGTHVVQRLLFCFSSPSIDWIYAPVVSNLVNVAHHPYGLCVLKTCISQAKPPSPHQQLLLAQLAHNSLDLVQSPYGNYAIQHAVEEWGGDVCLPIFLSLEGRMMQLSIQKFSSNVVEKIFSAAPFECRRRLIDELIGSDKISVLVNSNYGHYVVKRALQLAEPHQVQALVASVRGNIAQLPNKRLRATWEKVIGAGSKRMAPEAAAVAPAEEHFHRQAEFPAASDSSQAYRGGGRAPGAGRGARRGAGAGGGAGNARTG